MGWREQLHPRTGEREHELREMKQRREDKAASYDKGEMDDPERQKVIDDKECVVRKCSALKCKHNHKARCTLPEIDLDRNAKCRDYTPITDYPQEKRPPERQLKENLMYDGPGSPMDLMRRASR